MRLDRVEVDTPARGCGGSVVGGCDLIDDEEGGGMEAGV